MVSAEDLRGPLAALTYACVSILIMMFNKAVLSEFNFGHFTVLTMLQSMFTAFSLTVLSRVGVIDVAPLQWSVAKRVAPLSFMFLGYVLVSLAALGVVNMPMFTALRRTSVLFISILQYYIDGSVPAPRIRVAIGVMLLGATIAAAHDVTFDIISLVLLVVTNTMGALYNIFIKRVRDDTNLNVLSLLYYNTVITTPFLAAYCWLSGELGDAMSYESDSPTMFRICFLGSCILAFLLNWTTFRNTTINSPLTQTVVGQAKNFVAFLISLVAFSDWKFNFNNFVGLLIGFVGGILYAYAKVRAKMEQNAARTAGDKAAASSKA